MFTRAFIYFFIFYVFKSKSSDKHFSFFLKNHNESKLQSRGNLKNRENLLMAESWEQTREAGWYPYMKLGEKVQKKIEDVEEKLDDHFDQTATFHVHPPPKTEEADEGWFDPFPITLPLKSTVDEVKKTIIESTQGTWSPIDPEKNIAVTIERTPMRKGETLEDHRAAIERGKRLWPEPYSGIMFAFSGDHIPIF